MGEEVRTGMEGQGQPSQLSDYELSADLRPVSSLSKEEVKAELAKMGTGDPKHPLWDYSSLHHKSAVERRLALIDRLRPTEEEKKATFEEQKKQLDARIREIEEKNAEEDARIAADRCESALQMRWRGDYQKNLGQLREFVDKSLSSVARDLLETPDPKTGVPLGDNPEFISDLHALLRKHGVAR